jgi:putative phosphoesterase
MKVLVVSDTHLGPATVDHLPDEVWKMADEADAVLHAGDVTEGALLHALAERAPVHAVLGNNDHALRGQLPEVLELELDGVTIGIIHDSGTCAGRAARMARRFPAADVVVFGHSHDPLVEPGLDGQLLVNPGSPTQRRRQPVHTVAWLELSRGTIAEARIVEVGPLA